LLPTFLDQGITKSHALSAPVRGLHLLVPGLTTATLENDTLKWKAVWEDQGVQKDVTSDLDQIITLASASPLILALEIPVDWQGHHSCLHVKLAVKPYLAQSYLKADRGYLYYRIALGEDTSGKPPKPTTPPPASLSSLPLVPINKGSFK
jgi:hypothetical protein